MIPRVDSDTLALAMIELFSDEGVMKRMSEALYLRELVKKIDDMTRTYPCRADYQRHALM